MTAMAAKLSKTFPDWLGTVVTSLVAVAAVTTIVLMQSQRLRRPSLETVTPQQLEQQDKTRLNVLRQTPTFGFSNLLASWTFLNFLQYFGDDSVRQVTGYSLNDDYFDIITRLDPRFAESYLFLSASVSYYQGNPELAIEYMKRGTRALSPEFNPKSFLVWRFMGLDQLLLVGDIPGAIRSYEMAAAWTQGTPYADLGPIFQQTADFLRRDPDSATVRFKSWVDVYAQADAVNDKLTRQRAKDALLEMGAKVQYNEKGELYFVPPEDIGQKD